MSQLLSKVTVIILQLLHRVQNARLAAGRRTQAGDATDTTARSAKRWDSLLHSVRKFFRHKTFQKY